MKQQGQRRDLAGGAPALVARAACVSQTDILRVEVPPLRDSADTCLGGEGKWGPAPSAHPPPEPVGTGQTGTLAQRVPSLSPASSSRTCSNREVL